MSGIIAIFAAERSNGRVESTGRAESSPRTPITNAVCRVHPESGFYRERVKLRSPETVADIAIILIHQTDYLLMRLIETAKQRFLKEEGIREAMTRARINYRNEKKR